MKYVCLLVSRVHFKKKKKKTATVFETRLSLKEKTECLLKWCKPKNAAGGLGDCKFNIIKKFKYNKTFLINKQERSTQYEEFSALFNSNWKH